MKKIGLISDTHGYLDDAVFTHFKDCDEIWHAGDFGPDVANRLSEFKPLRGVYGNIDDAEIRIQYPEKLFFNCEEVAIFMIHIGGYPPKYAPSSKADLMKYKPKLFISGHSHILKVMYDKDIACLHLNPGAAGKQGWQKVRTLLRFCISEERIHDMEVIELAGK